MNLAGISVKRPVTVLMLTFIAIILGGVSLTRLPIDLLPQMEIPVAIVATSYQGVGPREIEKMITEPIEGAVATVEGIENVSSVSSEGNSIVIAQFKFGTDMDFATLKMREKVDMVKRFLPEDIEAPMVLKIDPQAQPIIMLTLSSEDGDLAKLQALAEDKIKPRLEKSEGVASVSVDGGYKNQVEIRTHQEALKGYGLSIDYLSKIIGAENLNAPGGKVQKGPNELTIRTNGEFQSLDDIKSLLIPLPQGGAVRLSDIADVELKHNELDAIAKTNGKNSIGINIQKQSGTNTVKVSQAVNKEIEKIKQDYPASRIETVFDQAVYIRKSINSVYDNAVQGAILAIAILFLFLRNIRTTLIIGTAIPVSIITTFSVLYFSGITLNLMTLGGLALGVGMLVDNAIVALENIFRHRQAGLSRLEAAIKGASEVGMALTASTLTTVAVFLPIVFVQGITATIFRELALTVTISLLVSLVVSLSLVPMLSSKFLAVDRSTDKPRGLRRITFRIYAAFDTFFKAIDNRYRRLLQWALGHRKSTVLISFLVFVLSSVSIVTVGAEFFPGMDEGYLEVKVSLPDGAELKQTDEALARIVEKTRDIPEIDSVFTVAGMQGTMSLGGSTGNKGFAYIKLKDLKERTRKAKEIADQVRSLVKDLPGMEISVSATQSMSFGGSSTPISVKIKGDDLNTLKKIGNDFKKLIESVEGTREVKVNLAEGVQEVQVTIDRPKASQYGLTAGQIAAAVKGTISGTTATRYKYAGKQIDVVIKGDESYKESVTNLEQIPIPTPSGINIPLGQVAKVSIERSPSTINREDQVREITVTSQIIGRDLKSIATDVEKKLSSYELPDGYEYKIGGENEELTNAFKDLSLALILAVVLVYMILASQFESLLHPFTIMLSVPMGFSGGMLGLFVTRKPLSVPAFIGVILLAGIVVNNAIVLVDYINTRRKYGEERNQAVVNAGPIRLRPILMTTLTTVLGLIPLALGLGEGAEAQAPMAIVVISGLTLSTLSTLVLIPVVYTIHDDLAQLVKLKIFKKTQVGQQA